MSGRIIILGIPIDSVTRAEALGRIRTMLAASLQSHVVTPNPEMLVKSSDPAFRTVLAHASLAVPDGAGLLFASRLLRDPLPERVTGTDLVTDIAGLPEASPIFFLGAAEGVAALTAQKLKEDSLSLHIAGTYSGSPSPGEEEAIVRRINLSNAKTLFVAYGAPAQDLWIARNLKYLTSVRVAMGVGGAFDFISGRKKRAPMWMQRIGIEWLWRLMLEPRRIKRIWNATVVFPILVFRYRAKPIR